MPPHAVATPPPPPAATAHTAKSAKPPVPLPEVAEKPLPQPPEAMKRLVDSIPQTDLGKMINRWMRTEPARPTAPSSTQTD